MAKKVRIGGGAGFWGDSAYGPLQLIEKGNVHYLMLDYLAEITMSVLARAQARQPDFGYATDFVSLVIGPLASAIKEGQVRVVANAGGVNPLACRDALVNELSRRGVELKVAAVLGDDVMPDLERVRAAGLGAEMWTGEPLPGKLLTANAYLGGFPIAAALDAGADIVITGRCADSALVLGPLIHEFGWQRCDHDRLASGSLAGHVIECGVQATGGFYTDWREVADGWHDMGFPIAECYADGTFEITKPAATGGVVSIATIGEQITYETGDPSRYVLPDVVCDLSNVTLEQVAPDRVRVTGVKGLPATPHLKVSATYPDGYRCLATLMVKGFEASAKADAMAKAILRRTRQIFNREGIPDYTETSTEVLGAEATYGPHARAQGTREVVMKLAVRHARKEALELFSREIFPAATSMCPGIAGIFGGRPKVQPVARLFSFLIPKSYIHVKAFVDDRSIEVPWDVGDVHGIETSDLSATELFGTHRATPSSIAEPTVNAVSEKDVVTVPLISIARARSGDKGDVSNIAVLARESRFVSVLREQLTEGAVANYLAHVAHGRVQRFEWPGLDGFNFILHEALGGGGVASLRYDPQGKGHAQMLLEFPVRVPREWISAAKSIEKQ